MSPSTQMSCHNHLIAMHDFFFFFSLSFDKRLIRTRLAARSNVLQARNFFSSSSCKHGRTAMCDVSFKNRSENNQINNKIERTEIRYRRKRCICGFSAKLIVPLTFVWFRINNNQLNFSIGFTKRPTWDVPQIICKLTPYRLVQENMAFTIFISTDKLPVRCPH